MKRDEALGHFAAIFCILVWGLTFISTKILLRDFAPFQILFIRFLIGWLALWAAAPKKISTNNKKDLLLFAGAGFSGVTLYFLLENVALTVSFASNVGVIVTVAPFFTGLLAWKFLASEKPASNFFIGFVVAIIGIAMISFNGASFKMSPFGDLLALLAALSWAIYSILTRKLAAPGRGSLATTRAIFFWGLVFMLPVILYEGINLEAEKLFKPVNALNMLFLGLLASALCFAAWTFSLKSLGAVKTSAYIYLVPVVTVFAAALVLHEPITWLSAGGALLTITGLVLAESRFPVSKKQA
ncbi:MAG: DMT family transporter [Desulfovibrio sp.]|jgi:Predicted permease, DMT superfamily